MGNELTQQQEQSPKSQMLSIVENRLGEMLKKNIEAFPKGFNETRFLQNCITVLQETKEIEKCNPASVVRTLIKGAYLGLDFFRKECYAIPYNCNIGTKDRPVWEKQLQFQTDYKGEIKLCAKYGRGIRDIYAKLVREGDVLEVGIENGIQSVKFTEKLFNNGDIQGAFAVVVFDNGTTRYETMSLEELEYVRTTFSKAKDSDAWIKSRGEMYKKTVLRRLCKMLDLHFDSSEQEKAYIEGHEVDLTGGIQHEPKKADNPFSPKDGSKTTGTVQAAEIVTIEADPDAELRAALKKQFANEEDWQIEVRIKESREGGK